jgi:hypothetical protein
MESSYHQGVTMKTKVRDVREVDGVEGTTVSAQVFYSLIDNASLVEVGCNDHAWPHQSAKLPPAAARTLARYLLEKADEADQLDSARNEGTEVTEMACTTCRCPADPGFGSALWVHRHPADAFRCPASPVMVMVAAGA